MCTGALEGYIVLAGKHSRLIDWGFTITQSNKWIFTSGWGDYNCVQSNVDGRSHKVWIIDPPTEADWAAHTSYVHSFDPIANLPNTVLNSIGNPVNLSNDFEVMGIAEDNDGFLYINILEYGECFEIEDQHIVKYTPAGVYVAHLTQANGVDYNGAGPADGGFGFSESLVYDPIHDRLYVGGGPDADCVAVIDASTLTYLPTPTYGVANVPGQNGKGIVIVNECCPINLAPSFTRNLCGAVGQKYFLNQEVFSSCDGIVCGSSWVPQGTLTGMTFDACDNSVTITGPGCGTFTLNTAAMASTGCAAQNSTFTICNFLPPSGITLTQTAPTCTGSTANNNGGITLVSATNADKWGISTLNAGTYDGNNYASATAYTANTVVQTAVPNTGGTYILRVFNGSDGCYSDQTITVTTVTCSCPSGNCGTATIQKD